MNSITLIGNLGQDPVSRFTADNKKVTSFSIATKGRKAGADVTSWFRVSVWGERYDKMLAHVKKGSGLVVIGELQKPETYVDKEGKTQIRVEVTASSIHFLPSKPQDSKIMELPSQKNTGTSDEPFVEDSDLPF